MASPPFERIPQHILNTFGKWPIEEVQRGAVPPKKHLRHLIRRIHQKFLQLSAENLVLKCCKRGFETSYSFQYLRYLPGPVPWSVKTLSLTVSLPANRFIEFAILKSATSNYPVWQFDYFAKSFKNARSFKKEKHSPATEIAQKKNARKLT